MWRGPADRTRGIRSRCRDGGGSGIRVVRTVRLGGDAHRAEGAAALGDVHAHAGQWHRVERSLAAFLLLPDDGGAAQGCSLALLRLLLMGSQQKY